MEFSQLSEMCILQCISVCQIYAIDNRRHTSVHSQLKHFPLFLNICRHWCSVISPTQSLPILSVRSMFHLSDHWILLFHVYNQNMVFPYLTDICRSRLSPSPRHSQRMVGTYLPHPSRSLLLNTCWLRFAAVSRKKEKTVSISLISKTNSDHGIL